jgi:hypothetical protein
VSGAELQVHTDTGKRKTCMGGGKGNWKNDGDDKDDREDGEDREDRERKVEKCRGRGSERR